MPALGRAGQRRDGDANGRHYGEQEGKRGGWGGGKIEGGEMGDEGASGHKSGSRLIISATGPPAPGIHHHQPTETIILFMKNQIYKLLQIVLQFV